jgi:hypothetical protein
MRLGAAPSVHVSGSGTFVGDSLHMRILGTGIEGQLNGQLANGDRLPSILALNNLDTLSLLMERQPSP